MMAQLMMPRACLPHDANSICLGRKIFYCFCLSHGWSHETLAKVRTSYTLIEQSTIISALGTPYCMYTLTLSALLHLFSLNFLSILISCFVLVWYSLQLHTLHHCYHQMLLLLNTLTAGGKLTINCSVCLCMCVCICTCTHAICDLICENLT